MSGASLSYRFKNPRLQEQALTHRSLGRANNERLEFLGDALVNLLVAELIYERYPSATEGDLTRLRARLVNGQALAGIARSLELGGQLRLGPGELKSGGHRRDSILADAFEALIAAIYLDGGWQECRVVVQQLFAELLANSDIGEDKDPKTRLQERLQAKGLALPHYELIATSGEEHAKVFEVNCVVEALGLRTNGSGNSRRLAEQLAAESALLQMDAKLGRIG